MQRIYSWVMNKKDLTKCLLVNRAGFGPAAKELYREMKSELDVRVLLIKAGCPQVSPSHMAQLMDA